MSDEWHGEHTAEGGVTVEESYRIVLFLAILIPAMFVIHAANWVRGVFVDE